MRELETAFDRIEQTVLPSIAAVLDAVINSAAGARPDSTQMPMLRPFGRSPKRSKRLRLH